MQLFVATFISLIYANIALCSTHEVFIYYANETNANELMQQNYEILDKWLRSDPENSQAIKIADQLIKDRIDFPKYVLEERQAIASNLSARPDTAVVLFTNARAAHKEYEIRRPGENFFQVKKIHLPELSNYLLQSMPLADPAVFSAALRQVVADFDPKYHRYTLVTKSHGNSRFAIVPRIAARNEETTREEILSIASMSGTGARRASLPQWVNSIGISKEEYFATIARFGENFGMDFDLIYLEACHVQEGIQERISLPKNIRALVAPKTATDYRVIDYQRLFTGSAASIGGGLLQALGERFPEAVATRESLSIWHRIGKAALFSVPLFIFGLIFLLRHARDIFFAKN